MFGKFVRALLFLPLTACAQPKYLSQSGLAGGGEKPAREVTADCTLRFANSGLCFAWSWKNKPPVGKAGSLLLKIYRPNLGDGSAVPVDATPALVLWMPEHGHGSAETEIERVDVGTYLVKNIVPVMSGTWWLKFQILGQDGAVKDEVIVIQNF